MPLRRPLGYTRMGGRLRPARVRRAQFALGVQFALCAQFARCGQFALWLALALALGCASTPDPTDSPAGVTHTLQPGENLYRLSRFYGVSVDDIVSANEIVDVTQLSVGQRIWIPGAKRGAAGPGGSGASGSASPFAGDLDLIWPVRGKPGSRFGGRNGRGHDGLDIPAREGTPIVAAAAGRVIHSGSDLGDYGRVVILKHAGHYSTVYAHNRRNRVDKGDFVEKGQVIGEVGSSGNASGPHVHFEVRRDRKPMDPLLFLP